jgi:superfamily II DNA or RNA helicase
MGEEYIEADMYARHLTVAVTGARSGETIRGTHNVSKDAVIKIKEGIIPPSKRSLDTIRAFPTVWSMFIDKLGSVSFFAELTRNEREEWLAKNEKDGDFDLSEGSEVWVDIVDIGKSTFLTIDGEITTTLLAGNEDRDDRAWTLSHIRSLFPRKPGSNARRHTLIFLIYFWKVADDMKKVGSFEGLSFGMSPSSRKFMRNAKGNIYIFNNVGIDRKDLGVVIEEVPKTVPNYTDFLLERYPSSKKDYELLVAACKNFTAAAYKSLLQKLIRFTPLTVDIGGVVKIDAEFALAATFTILLTHPGSFVPDIQRFVSGQESAVKRLAVSILEDSYVEDDNKLLFLMIMSLLTQRLPRWKLSKKEYMECLDICKEAISTRKAYDYSISEGLNFNIPSITEKNTNLWNIAALLNDVRSFMWDIGMTASIAHRKGIARSLIEYERPKTMDLFHCIDHHWAPEMAFFLPLKIINQYKVVGSKPFANLFHNLFYSVTGVNLRKGKKLDSNSYFVKHIKEAQRRTLLAKQTQPIIVPANIKERPYKVKVCLSESWIAGLLGPQDVRGNPPIMVTLKPDDPYQLVAIRRPTRGMKDGTLPDDKIEDALAQIKSKLTLYKVDLIACTPPIKSLVGAKLTMRKTENGDDLYKIVYKCKEKTWDEIASGTTEVPISEMIRATFDHALMYTGDTIQPDAFKRLDKLMDEYSIGTIQRLITYISSYRAIIEVSRLSRDGGGTAQAVVAEDVGVCQILLYVSLLFPAGISRMEGFVSKFKVNMSPLAWEIRDHILSYINIRSSFKEEEIQWVEMVDSSNRVVRNYQKDCLDEMVNKGKKGHFLWVPTGMGKTLIVLNFLKVLRDTNKLPPYVLYALPRSALKSIIREIEFFGIPINVLLPIKGWKAQAKKLVGEGYIKDNEKLLPYHINIIEHDHLRLMEEEIIKYISNGIFIIDEVHKALNDTKRTNVALEISKLSKDFVAMTGTPIVDSNTYKLIWWLEQIVDFEVTDKNFWVAANGMIAKKVNTGIEIDKQEVLADFTTKEYNEYKKIVPASLGGINSKASMSDINQAFELCYKVCDKKMVEMCGEFLSENKRVMLVSRNTKHQNELQEMLRKKGITNVYLLQKDESIFITDETVESGETPNYDVVIVPQRRSEGYTLTRMRVMITGVYPSNNATREQLEGRINRLSQHAKVIHYRKVHCGILTYVLERHWKASCLSAVLSALADEIDLVK